jgi:hypothetical protein
MWQRLKHGSHPLSSEARVSAGDIQRSQPLEDETEERTLDTQRSPPTLRCTGNQACAGSSAATAVISESSPPIVRL